MRCSPQEVAPVTRMCVTDQAEHLCQEGGSRARGGSHQPATSHSSRSSCSNVSKDQCCAAAVSSMPCHTAVSSGRRSIQIRKLYVTCRPRIESSTRRCLVEQC